MKAIRYEQVLQANANTKVKQCWDLLILELHLDMMLNRCEINYKKVILINNNALGHKILKTLSRIVTAANSNIAFYQALLT